MLIDIHCHIDAYPQPVQALAAGQAAGVRTVAVTTSLASYVRTRLLCRHHPDVHVALGLHPHRVAGGYDQWAEWQEVLGGASLVGEAGLDFRHGKEQNWAAQVTVLREIAAVCGRENRPLMLHSRYAEAEAWGIVVAQHVNWVIWHDYRPEGPKSLLFRTIEAGHFLAVGPDLAASAAMRTWLRAIPREQVLTETNGPWSRLGTGDRALALREIVARLAEVWRTTPEEAEAQVERNYQRLMAAVEKSD
ncbi:MAG TPA: TatD family hydrolase [Anaerolineae bacterium]|nr:TatD family hydrolase [Anaerolineae bacterium]HOR00241.1 TatD family hydrolase [Anaerolineae bacterium]HPL27761.1 TatD family hydrolase [Anaerolineae bacterium]